LINTTVLFGSGSHVQIEGDDYLNFATHGFLNYHLHPKIIDTAVECTNHFGVGACGPRGFYGSFDTHMELEKTIAKYWGTDDSVVFSSEFQTIASVIPSFSKPGDFLICDKGVSFAIQNGILLSRSTVKWFDHNNIQDQQRVIQGLTEVFQKKKHRVFLLVESIYAKYGDLLDLKAVLELKEKYPFRIILEESLSIGVLGKTGRGLTEHIGVPSTRVEIITSSIGNALGSVGGFATGTAAICAHMRLNCSGYVFSCSSPPYLMKACTAVLSLLSSGKEIKQLNQNTKTLHKGLATIKFLKNCSSPVSPYVILKLTRPSEDKEEDERKIQKLVNELFRRKIVVARVKYSEREVFKMEPHFKITVTTEHTQNEIERLIQELDDVCNEIKK